MKRSRLKKSMKRKVKPTKKWFRYVIADEKKASNDYARHGFPVLARQEAHHRVVLKKAMRKMGL